MKSERNKTNITPGKISEICDTLYPVQEELEWIRQDTGNIQQIETEKTEKTGTRIRKRKAPEPDGVEVVELIIQKEPEWNI